MNISNHDYPIVWLDKTNIRSCGEIVGNYFFREKQLGKNTIKISTCAYKSQVTYMRKWAQRGLKAKTKKRSLVLMRLSKR